MLDLYCCRFIGVCGGIRESVILLYIGVYRIIIWYEVCVIGDLINDWVKSR